MVEKNAKKNPTAYTYKTSTIKLKNPTRKGYVFKGWYLDKKFKKKLLSSIKEAEEIRHCMQSGKRSNL